LALARKGYSRLEGVLFRWSCINCITAPAAPAASMIVSAISLGEEKVPHTNTPGCEASNGVNLSVMQNPKGFSSIISGLGLCLLGWLSADKHDRIKAFFDRSPPWRAAFIYARTVARLGILADARARRRVIHTHVFGLVNRR
jgi:hypothetical protein